MRDGKETERQRGTQEAAIGSERGRGREREREGGHTDS